MTFASWHRSRWFLQMFCLALAGCTPWAVNTGHTALRISGSDTMAPLVQRWGVAFMEKNPKVLIESEAGGSGYGIEALIGGRVDLCAASRPMEAEEVRRLQQARGALGVSILTARDALSIYVHPDNPVQALTLDQVRGIFDGELHNWRQLGGPDRPIRVIHRQPNSGTHHFLRTHVLLAEAYAETGTVVANTEAVIRGVATDAAAIGYGGVAYGQGIVTHCHIEGVEPSAANVRTGTYPITRYLYLYSVQEPIGLCRLFVDWVLSDPGQQIVAETGYVPLWNARN
ncbi:MAG: phosphate ABC transporter substrate-binding protein [bacterium]|nr:phosphate ABC transporter substrate-binding protein [bacterium]